MLRQIWIAECDLCGKIEPAQHTNGRYEPEYVLPAGWGQKITLRGFYVASGSVIETG